ncbi:MAG: hybrid sensor histidine kinase/response regulator [Myxococcales bacterium]|nr:hybrid sensor histidine kinase/response regulator [Myxococcales bacterium]MCB9714532.1 hybrid sensor histidine kinase/response regulator [Myxococcales bacterium]
MPLFEVDERGHVHHANVTARERFGHPSACSLATCLGAAAAQEILARLERARRDGVALPWASELLLADGTTLTAQLAVSALPMAGGPWRALLNVVPSASQATAIEKTQRPITQELPRMLDRHSAVQTLASGVAHEIGNPLTYMLMCLDDLARSVEETDHAPMLGPLLDKTQQGAKRVRDIVRGLSSYDRDHGRRERVDVNRAVRNALEMARTELLPSARVHTSLEEVPSVEANPSRLAQVLYNLVVNAAHALEPGQAEAALGVETWSEGSWVFINVWDTGRGIDESIRDQIFEPFVTSKPAGQGAGLGLAVCHNYVAELAGEIDFDCEPEQGTRFTVRLPAAPPEPKVASPLTERRRAEEVRLLVVDDEPEIRRGLQAMLRRFGQVDIAESAAEARGLLSSEIDYDLVLCDLMMPGESGEELYGWIATTRPELAPRVVYVSGGGPRLRGSSGSTEGPPCLLKPFRRQELYEFVRRNMARSSSFGIA